MLTIRGHKFEEKDGALVCSRCLRSWGSERSLPRNECPGVKWYTYGTVPAGLLSFTQLRQRRLKPRDREQPDGCVFSAGRREFIYLYAEENAVPMRVETEKQRAARLKAWENTQNKYKCEHCGSVPQSLAAIQHQFAWPGLCIYCKERLEWVAEAEALDAQIEEDRLSAAAWAHDLLRRDDWALVDTETTSLYGVVIEVAAIAPNGSTLFHALVNPECRIQVEARLKHGITNKEVANAPTLPDVWPQLLQVLEGRSLLIAYNSEFDSAVLARSAARYNLPKLPHKWQCAMEAYAEFCGEWSDYYKDYRWQPLGGSHRALGDCLAALDRIREMAATYQPEEEAQGKKQSSESKEAST